jgi:hypothetical protein
MVRLVRPLKLAGVHGYRWTFRSSVSVDVKCTADEISGQPRECRAGIDAPSNPVVD